ncbi:MAG: sulfatase [Thermoanaerobaculia bacterium]|nr:sulfatase [Thermoanaerobaculia bacterium]
MSRRTPRPDLRRGAPLAALLLFGLALASCSSPPPNLILISLDTLRPDHVGAYGYERDTTPNLDALAARGALFETAYAHAPNTAPSHTSLLTSLYPTVHGVWNHGIGLDPSVPTLAGILAENGYDTAAWVQLVGSTYQSGFATYQYIGDPETSGKGFGSFRPVERMLEWIDGRERPFFLFVHTYDVHLPYEPRRKDVRRFAGRAAAEGLRRRIPQWYVRKLNRGEWELTDEVVELLVAYYDAELFRLDELLGRFFDGLAERGLEDRTVIAVVSDHGEEFGERGQFGRHSYSLREEILRVPLILAGPGVPEGVRTDVRVGLVDVAPSLLRLAGLEPPAGFQGRDLAPVWSGGETEHRTVLAGKRLRHVLLEGPYKYETNHKLFHLGTDPGERRDLAGRLPEIARRMRARARHLVEEHRRLGEGIASAGPRHLTPEQRKTLRALGYVD